MMASYLPTLRYYRRSVLWALALPLVGGLYLFMTWSSALRFGAGNDLNGKAALCPQFVTDRTASHWDG